MVELKCTEIIFLSLDYTQLDCSSRQYEDQGRVFYLGQGTQVIQFFERDLDKVIELLNKVKALPMTEIRVGRLK